MSILKSTVSGKTNVPITLEWLLDNGWQYEKTKDCDTLKTVLDRTKICCDGHFLNIENFVHGQEIPEYKIYWSYKTNASKYKFYIKTFAYYDKIVKYYKEQRPKERAKLKNKILQQPGIEKTSLLWFSGDIEEPKLKKSTTSFKVSYNETDMF